MQQNKNNENNENSGISEIFIHRIKNKYRLHLLKNFRKFYKIQEGDLICVIKDPRINCPFCNEKIKLPGSRIVFIKKDDITLVITEENPELILKS